MHHACTCESMNGTFGFLLNGLMGIGNVTMKGPRYEGVFSCSNPVQPNPSAGISFSFLQALIICYHMLELVENGILFLSQLTSTVVMYKISETHCLD